MFRYLLRTRDEFSGDPFARPYRIAFFVLLLGICCFVRLWDLGWKSMMHDELLFTNYSYYDLYLNFGYRYQPILHGPLMLHIQNVVFHVFGASDYTVRLGVALLGIGGFFWIWTLRHWLGEAGTWFSLLFYGISPGIAFFHRFYHMDSLYMFCTLWIVASLANWWRTGDARWGASAIIAITALFNNKASSIFLYFTIATFALLVIVHDLAGYFVKGKDSRLKSFLRPAAEMPGTTCLAIVMVVPVILVLTQVFEGLRYDQDVRQTLGHDFALKEIRSIPLALGWIDVDSSRAPEAGAMADRSFWMKFYALLLLGGAFSAAVLKVAADHRVGHREFASRAFDLVHRNRWYLVGALAFSAAFYLAVYTTFFKHRIGFFEIYKQTWAYWGGQHEIGRIKGPFHQHMLNILVYETPALLIVVGAWLAGLFRMRWRRLTGMGILLAAVPLLAFHKLIFSGLGFADLGDTLPVDANVGYMKVLAIGVVLVAAATIFAPATGKVLFPLSFVGVIAYSVTYFSSPFWRGLMRSPVFRDGEPVHLMGSHVNFRDFIEIRFNFDGGSSILIVLILVLFASVYTWNAIDRGRFFHGFLVWWFVTMLGAASYAREAVPQVGIHAMLPIILLAGSYVNQAVLLHRRKAMMTVGVLLLGVMVLWSAKACFNLNFHNAHDPRERMAYGPSNPDVKAHMSFIRDYVKIAPLRLNPNGTPVVYTNYNDVARHKDVRIMMRRIDQVTWPAKWYLRDIHYEDTGDPARAIDEGYEFLFLRLEDAERYPALSEKYHVMRGRGTSFWMPDMISPASLASIWKEWIPGHYLDATPQAFEAFQAKQDWRTVWRYLIHRETFDGTGRPVPSVSSFEYLFCYRKDLF